ncbi:CiaD-like domain-containing protein [Sulfurimonas paralvinellae]|uniref:Campylobacter invasion antigen D C-terminal domain-containing protein n=1 Tax=Sulfurimonas paralvinellae TaxID=317658 RepID=A0A7M1B7H4_9BACT|nr:hypothetical protein [Sulfurimonas paralvinellae]QOP45640.1 hypothetical protein FM071_04795 [Sulfurimonas paralvinellae]
MELKDVILSTLAEMEDDAPITESIPKQENTQKVPQQQEPLIKTAAADESSVESELIYLNSIRERLLVLFEGFQAPNNANIEAKIDMTLNFLEYTLATIDARVEKLEKGNMK